VLESTELAPESPIHGTPNFFGDQSATLETEFNNAEGVSEPENVPAQREAPGTPTMFDQEDNDGGIQNDKLDTTTFEKSAAQDANEMPPTNLAEQQPAAPPAKKRQLVKPITPAPALAKTNGRAAATEPAAKKSTTPRNKRKATDDNAAAAAAADIADKDVDVDTAVAGTETTPPAKKTTKTAKASPPATKGAKTSPPAINGAVVLSGFTAGDEATLRPILTHLGDMRIVDSVTAQTTHVLSNSKRTQKVMLGIARGLWVVSPDWVYQSLEAGHWLPEGPFECGAAFPGAPKSREAKQAAAAAAVAKTPYHVTLFEGKTFLLGPQTSLPLADLGALIKLCGGKVGLSVCVGVT
jgi:hypothetical protein